MTNPTQKNRRIRSFICRNSRMTAGQKQAFAELMPQFGLSLTDGLADFTKIFSRSAPTFLEIGFGTGQSLVALAAAHPENNFIGVETHKPGVGALLLGVGEKQLTNLRVYNVDVVDVFTKCMPANCLDGINIFFPDPWQKRRHHLRRLIQPSFLQLIIPALKPNGTLHLATDWDDYATHMMTVLSNEKQLTNAAGEFKFATRTPFRPIVTKFEQRAIREGRKIWELQFAKSASLA